MLYWIGILNVVKTLILPKLTHISNAVLNHWRVFFTCLEKLPTFLKFYEKQRAKKSPSNLKETEESCLNYNTDYKNLF